MKGKSIDFELLKEICDVPGAPGHESRIRNLVLDKIQGADDVSVDHLGNIVAIKKGTNNPEGKKIMLAAHLDEIGFIVTHIDEQGFLKFHPLGGFDPKTLTSMRVLVHGKEDLLGVMGSKPIHVMKPEERRKAPELADFYIDLGLPKDEVEKIVAVGDTITRYQDLKMMGNLINGKSLDNRLSVYILLEVLRQLESIPYDVYGAFTVQEEVGLRGAGVVAHTHNPTFGLAIDVTIANDTPGIARHEHITQLGEGAAIKVLDSGVISDYRMVKFLKEVAGNHQITWQTEILTGGSTDAAGLQRMGKNGAIAGAISIPLRYVHQVTETAHPEDVSSTIALIVKACQDLDRFNWTH